MSTVAQSRVFRWEAQDREAFYAYSGGSMIGMAVRRHDGRYVWHIDAVLGSKYQRATRGESATAAGAKAAFRRAWLMWLAQRGLREG